MEKPFIYCMVFSIFFAFLNTCNTHSQETLVSADSLQFTDKLPAIEDDPDSATIDSISAVSLGLKLWPSGNYETLKKQIATKRAYFQAEWQKTNDSAKAKLIEQAGNFLFENLLNQIIPFWYGMPWDLSGYSNVPQKGTVGCSYFVSNTLVACGFNLNRYRLAQTDPIAGSQSLSFNDSVIHFTNEGDMEKLSKTILGHFRDGLYLIGLDIHVGYLLIYGSNLYFIHSSYYPPKIVCMEYFEKSYGISSSMNYYITPITNNSQLLEKWISREFIYIRKPVYQKVNKEWWDKQ
jgi:hypothetical protein